MKLPDFDIKWWHTLLVTIIILGTGSWGVYQHFAKAADLEPLVELIAENADRNFRLRQRIINDTRTNREERKLKPNPRWLKEQQQQLNYERCKQAQRRNKNIRCNK